MTVQDETREIAGRVISGAKIERAGRASRYVQKPIEEFFPILDAILDTPGVHSIRWTQDIPYFNDGEPCVFSTNGFTVRLLVGDETSPTRARLEADPEDGWDEREDGWDEREDEDPLEEPEYLGGYRTEYDGAVKAHVVSGPFDRLTGNTDHFQSALQSAFGDYAEVTAYKDSETGEYAFHVGEHEASY